jgi:small nuclear ribonucleoprotein (snRNP)-like protein
MPYISSLQCLNGPNNNQQLPLGLLTAAQGHPMLVELKNGETLNGHLVQCDTYMNLTLKEVVQTSPDGDKFFRLPECYVRGNNVSQPLQLSNETSSSSYIVRM